MVARKILTGILYVLSTGCRWEDVPRFPAHLLAETHNMGGGRHLRAPLARPAGSARRSRKERWDKAFLELPPIGRSGPTTRSILPVIVGPGLSYDPAHDDDHRREGNPKIDDPISTFGTPHELLVGVVPRVCALYYPALCGRQRSRLAFLGDSGEQAAVL